MSLKIRNDRLQNIIKTLPQSLNNVEVWPAVHGDSTGHPKYWSAGNGAWGCYRTHVNILEDAMQKQYASYLVLEDDALFSDDFDTELSKFMESLPDDWEQIYLGGQLLHDVSNPPIRINTHVYIPYNVNRTHAFGVHRRGYDTLYDHLFDLPFARGEHIDHHLGRLHESGKFNVYVPGKWLVGQDIGKSNISGSKRRSAEFWSHPKDCADNHKLFDRPLCIFLEASINVARQLHQKGWHFGKWLTDEGLDRGVCEAVSDSNPEWGLECWYNWVRREVIREKKVLPCLFHPKLTWDIVSKLKFAEFVRIKADSAQDGLEMLRHKLKEISF